MYQRRRICWYVVGTIVILLIAAGVFAAPAFAVPKQKVVRVAYPLQNGLTDIDENGDYCGYTYEYLEEIAQYTGWTYEFVQVSGTEEEQIATLKEMVKNGEVDLFGPAFYNEQLDKDFDYSGYSYGTVETVLQVLAGGEKRIVIDASQMQVIRIAVTSKEEIQMSALNEYCSMNLIKPILIECGSEAAMIEAMQNGRADTMLGTSMSKPDGLRIIASFAPRQIYFVTARNDPAGVLPELNEAMSNLYRTDPYFQSTLYKKYFAPQIYELSLSEEEQAYIEKIGSLKAGVLTDYPPFQYRDKVDGILKGIGIELLEHIAEKTGLHITMVEAKSQEALYEMASRGEIDLVAGMPYNYALASGRALSMTRPYVSCPYILLLNESISEDQINGKRLAMIGNSSYKGYLVGKVVSYDTYDECIRAVNKGDADYTYVDTYTAQYYINQPEFERLKMVPQMYQAPFENCFGIVAPADHELFNILNKAILSMPEEELQGIIYSNTIQKQLFSIGIFVQENSTQVILALAGIFLLILLLLLIILVQRIRAAKAISLELQKHKHLYAISNDYIFEYDYRKKTMMLSMPENQKISYFDYTVPMSEGRELESRIALMKLMESRKNGVFEERLYGPGGGWHWYRIVMETICDDTQKPVYAIGRLNMIDEERSERDKLLKKAQRDSLTNLYNFESSRTLIETKIQALKEGEWGALLLVDVDSFKLINDNYGHMRGDDILRELACLLQKSFREDDVVGRPGGDEFLVYMTRVRDREALEEKCRALSSSARQIQVDKDKHLTISIGAVLSTGAQDYVEMYQKADDALYAAKDAGRDGFYIFKGNQ